jgi:hypothetical protein
MSLVVSVVVGIASGLLASILFWYVQYRAFRVRLSLSPTIAKYRIAGEEILRYQFKITNTGRREAIDLRIMLTASIRDLVRAGSSETIALAEWSPPILRAGKSFRYRIEPTHMAQRSRDLYWKYFTPEIQDYLERREPIPLEKFLQLGSPASEFRVFVFATDALSGARSLASVAYTFDKIEDGRFKLGTFEHTGHLETDDETVDSDYVEYPSQFDLAGFPPPSELRDPTEASVGSAGDAEGEGSLSDG